MSWLSYVKSDYYIFTVPMSILYILNSFSDYSAASHLPVKEEIKIPFDCLFVCAIITRHFCTISILFMLENRLYTHFALLKSNLFSLFRFKLSLLLIRGNAVLVSSTAYRTVPQLLHTVPYRTALLIFFQHRTVPVRDGTGRYGISIAHRQSLITTISVHFYYFSKLLLIISNQ